MARRFEQKAVNARLTGDFGALHLPFQFSRQHAAIIRTVLRRIPSRAQNKVVGAQKRARILGDAAERGAINHLVIPEQALRADPCEETQLGLGDGPRRAVEFTHEKFPRVAWRPEAQTQRAPSLFHQPAAEMEAMRATGR
jgi:hypothetical protein